jgi:hypothetical protein
VVLDVIHERILAVAHRVESKTRMRGHNSERVHIKTLGVVALPRMDIHRHEGPFLVVGIVMPEPLEAVGNELDLARLGLEPLLFKHVAGAEPGYPAPRILLAALGKPPERGRGRRLIRDRDDVVAFIGKILP